MKKSVLGIVAAAFVAAICLNADAEDGKKKGDKKGEGRDRAAIFAKMDTNSDGKLTKEEFMARAKTDEMKEKMAKVFAHLDKNSDGSISKEEFTAAKPPRKKKPE